jgi:hypothetical protein
MAFFIASFHASAAISPNAAVIKAATFSTTSPLNDVFFYLPDILILKI